jgi:hypothetical protein
MGINSATFASTKINVMEQILGQQWSINPMAEVSYGAVYHSPNSIQNDSEATYKT